MRAPGFLIANFSMAYRTIWKYEGQGTWGVKFDNVNHIYVLVMAPVFYRWNIHK